MARHDDLLARHRRVMPSWMPLYYERPIALVDGSGRHVVDAEGNRYLDFFGGVLTTMIGYNVPEIVEAVREQAGRMVHTSTLYLIEQQIELAERIAELSGIPDAKVFFTNSGTEANEAALLLATAYRRSNQVLAMRNSYHGRSYAAMGVTGNRAWSPSGLSPLQVSYLHGTDRERFPHLSDAEFVDFCVEDLRQVLATATSGDVACLIAEPIQGVGGFTAPPDGLYRALHEVLAEYGILFVADEVQTGWGRTGDHYWGIQAHGVVPDAMTFAKGLGNGLAIGGVVARAELMDCLTAISFSTFGGNPLATRAALAVLDYVRDHDLQDNARRMGRLLREGLELLRDKYSVVRAVRGRGLMLGLELADPETATKVLEETRARGLLVGKGGLVPRTLRIAPPLTVTEEEVREALAVLGDAIKVVSVAA